MKKLTFGIMAADLLFGMSTQAEAKGCLKDAAAGCAVGHHMAKKKQKEADNQHQSQK